MDSAQKRSLKKYLIFLLPFLIAPIYGWYKGFQTKARESYIRLLAESINFAEHSYHQEFKSFSGALRDVGFSASPKDIVIYTKQEDIPEAELKKISQEFYPFFGSDTYQMIIKHTDKDSNAETFWILHETGNVNKIAP